jgi:hypothetical protein
MSPTSSPDVFPNYVADLTDSDAAANRAANMLPTPSLGVFPDSGADLFSNYVADLLNNKSANGQPTHADFLPTMF